MEYHVYHNSAMVMAFINEVIVNWRKDKKNWKIVKTWRKKDSFDLKSACCTPVSKQKYKNALLIWTYF